MARKRNPAPDPAPPEPSTEAATPLEPDTLAKASDMPVGEMLRMLGRILPEGSPTPARPTPALPAGMNPDIRLSDLTVRELLQLLESF